MASALNQSSGPLGLNHSLPPKPTNSSVDSATKRVREISERTLPAIPKLPVANFAKLSINGSERPPAVPQAPRSTRATGISKNRYGYGSTPRPSAVRGPVPEEKAPVQSPSKRSRVAMRSRVKEAAPLQNPGKYSRVSKPSLVEKKKWECEACQRQFNNSLNLLGHFFCPDSIRLNPSTRIMLRNLRSK